MGGGVGNWGGEGREKGRERKGEGGNTSHHTLNSGLSLLKQV